MGDGFHWIAPSRFGYLRSTFHDGATFDDQAHAFAALLDRLGIRRTAVVALSHGGPSALLFATLYPDRVTSLTLLSAGVAALTPEQRRLADEVVDFMNPVAPRAAGVRFDNTAALPNARIAAIRAPTLVVHARDDRLQLYRNAEYAVATIPGARLLAFPRGGHLLLAVEQPAIRAAVTAHIAQHAGNP